MLNRPKRALQGVALWASFNLRFLANKGCNSTTGNHVKLCGMHQWGYGHPMSYACFVFFPDILIFGVNRGYDHATMEI